ncbi:hypothetical protein JW921_09110 [Candidatus Fermentibacterales bacterium]|nr:hypothetical protein [Candidatus Fermentibacterales bacterium]
MAKLKELVARIDSAAKSGEREKALKMLESLLKKVPDNAVLLARKKKYSLELENQKRLEKLEKKYGLSG